MLIHETLNRGRTCHNLPGGSKKRTLEKVSELIAKSDSSLSSAEIFTGLIGRERLGSTGIGEGIAIPHCRLNECTKTIGALLKLAEPIDFDAIDGQPVDLIFVLLVPTEATDEHLQTLASLAELFNQEAFRNALRGTEDSDQLYEAAIGFTKNQQ
jgi:PTS system nitrogen regulatory IIA component